MQRFTNRALGVSVLTLTFLVALVSSGCQSVGSDASAEPERVLVGGATGRQGGAVVTELLKRGYRVRGMTRNPSSASAQALTAQGVEVVQADYGDVDSLLAAMQGVERMFFYSGFSRKEVEEGKNVIAAARQSGMQQVVYSSGAAAEPGKGVPGAAKTQVEEALVNSGLTYTVVRPVAFMENFDIQKKVIPKRGIVESRGPDRELHFISLPDIGLFVGEAFDHPDEWRNRATNIASDKMTVAEFVATFSSVMGRDVAYTRLPLDEYLAAFPKPLRPLFRWYDEVGYEADVAAFRAAYPGLTTLDDYLRETGWAEL